ncbi:Gfo/Idh/MocA family protein [Myceligenerans pegani]|uniref:Gfo/Idh/MocA family oxidoreductase n=1 Tax=Myceligenerans pegani TaxID=2776917 RepID=A0ABR9N4U7_9MICO|nr:Gfo/Idh/MocA family oxidoreductase [Myceligenerans sp. TRM 65318]MBE1878697.1 Gfo/Idh/MocA family oxidoreductase [Myceligenerans sp. TRM 65318]MBE3020968.1 Gfo/Idh/MocA family oxidoreductase [Myceligenerans sp. TRM 65318]
MRDVPRIAVVGVHGHGASHVRRVGELAARGEAELTAVVDPREPEAGTLGGARATWFASLGDLLSQGELPDVVVLSTPIHTHLPLAQAAMEAGIDVLLEKPTAASLAEHEALVAVAERTGRRCQVGFQTFGSHALPAVSRMIERGEIGEVTGIGAVGAWVRTASYWSRSAWAGRRHLDGHDVVDGVVTNPLAHAVATALRIGGARRADDVAYVDTDLWRANPIEADDTSSVRVVAANGTRYGFGLTLCAHERTPARVIVYGTEGTIALEYEYDRVLLRTGSVTAEKEYGRTSLLEDLLAARRTGGPLLCEVAETGAFMRVLEAVRTGAEPRAIGGDGAGAVEAGAGRVRPQGVAGVAGPAVVMEWRGEGGDRRPVIHDVERWCERVAETQKLFSELGAPWTAVRA